MVVRSLLGWLGVFVLLVTLGNGPAPAEPPGTMASGDGTFQMVVFGCYMPVPTTYVLNTRETKHISLFEEGGEGQIVVSDYAEFSDKFEIVKSKEVGPLTVLGVRYKGEFIEARGEARRFIVIHDGRRSVRIHGDDALADSMLEGCLKSKAQAERSQ